MRILLKIGFDKLPKNTPAYSYVWCIRVDGAVSRRGCIMRCGAAAPSHSNPGEQAGNRRASVRRVESCEVLWLRPKQQSRSLGRNDKYTN